MRNRTYIHSLQLQRVIDIDIDIPNVTESYWC